MRKAHLRLFPLGSSHLHHQRHLPRLPCPALASPSARSRRLPPCRHLPDALPAPPQARKALPTPTAPLPLLQPQAAEHASAAPLLQAPVTGPRKEAKNNKEDTAGRENEKRIPARSAMVHGLSAACAVMDLRKPAPKEQEDMQQTPCKTAGTFPENPVKMFMPDAVRAYFSAGSPYHPSPSSFTSVKEYSPLRLGSLLRERRTRTRRASRSSFAFSTL